MKAFRRNDYTKTGIGLEHDPTFPKQHLNTLTLGGVCSQCSNMELESVDHSNDWGDEWKSNHYRKTPIYSSGCPTCLILWQFRGNVEENGKKYGKQGLGLHIHRFNTAKLFYENKPALSNNPLAASASLHTDMRHTWWDVGIWRRNLQGTEAQPKGWFTPVGNPDNESAQEYLHDIPKRQSTLNL